MTVAPDPFQYVPVEGIPPESRQRWCFVLLCKSCLRVVGITMRPKVSDDSDNFRRTCTWDSIVPTPDICYFCGYVLDVTPPDYEGRVVSVYLTTARWHWTGSWVLPWTWRLGHWEIADFETFACRGAPDPDLAFGERRADADPQPQPQDPEKT